jgi:hypothetical protein
MRQEGCPLKMKAAVPPKCWHLSIKLLSAYDTCAFCENNNKYEINEIYS